MDGIRVGKGLVSPPRLFARVGIEVRDREHDDIRPSAVEQTGQQAGASMSEDVSTVAPGIRKGVDDAAQERVVSREAQHGVAVVPGALLADEPRYAGRERVKRLATLAIPVGIDPAVTIEQLVARDVDALGGDVDLLEERLIGEWRERLLRPQDVPPRGVVPAPSVSPRAVARWRRTPNQTWWMSLGITRCTRPKNSPPS